MITHHLKSTTAQSNSRVRSASIAVIGDTTNTAARLMTVGAPGQVVVSRATWDALGPDRQGVALGAATVKGRREPVDAWAVTAAG